MSHYHFIITSRSRSRRLLRQLTSTHESLLFHYYEQVPLFSDDFFDNYAPFVIVVLCGCTYLNLGSGARACCARCIPCVKGASFSFDDDFADSRIEQAPLIASNCV